MGHHKYHLAMDGDSWNVIQMHYPELMPNIVARGTIFARFRPEQKSQIVLCFQKFDYIVAMCGDGANDCGALRVCCSNDFAFHFQRLISLSLVGSSHWHFTFAGKFRKIQIINLKRVVFILQFVIFNLRRKHRLRLHSRPKSKTSVASNTWHWKVDVLLLHHLVYSNT